MVHIELIIYTTYCVIFSTACFLVLKKLYNKRLEKLEQLYQKGIDDLDSKFKELRIKQDKSLISTRYKVSNENKLYFLHFSIPQLHLIQMRQQKI